MFRVSGKASLTAPAKKVSAFLADPANENRWQSGVVHLRLLRGTAGIPGATYERVQIVAGRNLKTETRLLEHVEGKSVAFESTGKVAKFRTYYHVRDLGSRCELEMNVEGELLGFAAMFEGMAKEALEQEVPAALGRLPAAVT